MGKFKADVVIVEGKNYIGGRQGYAYVFNSGKIKTVKCDLDKPQEYDSFKEYDDVKVRVPYRNDYLDYRGTIEKSDGKWRIGGHSFGIKSSFGYSDLMEMANEANLPVVEAGDIIGLFEYSDREKLGSVRLYRIPDRVDPHCTVIATLIPLNDEEMENIRKEVDKWVNR